MPPQKAPPNRENQTLYGDAAGRIIASRWLVLAGAAIITFATTAVYWPCRNGDFLWDGGLLITKNPLVKAPDGLYRMWFSTEPVDYWPVTNSVFWLEWHLWGNNTTPYHIINIALQIANALLIWMILRRLSIPGAFLAALLFAVHPVNVESVAWIAQLKNALAVFFFLLSLWWFLKADPGLDGKQLSAPSAEESESGLVHRWYWPSLLAFTLAMLSKGSVAILPGVLLVLIWWKRDRIARIDLIRTAPFFVVAVVLTVVNIWFQTHGTGEIIRTATPLERILGASAVVWFYLYKALLPFDLSFVYPQWTIDAKNVLWWLPLAATLLVTALLVWQRRRSVVRPVLIAWLIFCAGLVPVMGLTDIYYMKFSLVADHYQYIAIISVLAMVAAIITTLTDRWATQLTVMVSAVLAFGCGILAWQQCLNYVDPEALYASVVEKNPQCWMAYNNRGVALSDNGQVDAAIESYRKALEIDPIFLEARNNLGVALAQQGHYQEAIDQYRQALRLKPDYADAHSNLGSALTKTGQFDEATKELQIASKLKPDLPELSFNLAYNLKQMGKFPEALRQYDETLRLEPDNPEVHIDLGVLLAAMGKPDLAVQHYHQALELNPRAVQAYVNFGDALVALGQPKEAVNQYLEALKIDPQYAAARLGLGTVYLRSQQLPQALNEFQQALATNPNNAEVHSKLGAALALTGQFEQAIDHDRQAIRLKPDYLEAQANLATALAAMDRREEAITTAENAIAKAHSLGKNTFATQLEGWLSAYRAQQPAPPKASAPPASHQPSKN